MKTVTAFAIASAVSLCAGCNFAKAPTMRFMAGGGYSEVDIDVSGAGSTDFDGWHGSLRAELAQAPDFAPNVEFGVRVLTGFHDIDESEGGFSFDFETFDLGAVAVVRPVFDLNDTWRLYVEGFGGYRQYWVDAEVSGFGFSVDDDDDDGGGIFGFGVGSEYMLSDTTRLLFGVEWSRHYTSQADADFDIDDLAALVGISIVF